MKVTDTNLIDYLRLYHIPFPIIYGSLNSDQTKKLEDEIIAIKNAQKSYTSNYSVNYVYTTLFNYCELFLKILGGDVLNSASTVDMTKVYESEQASVKQYLEMYHEGALSKSKTQNLYILVTKVYDSFEKILSNYVRAYRQLTDNATPILASNSSVLDELYGLIQSFTTMQGQLPSGKTVSNQKKLTSNNMSIF